MIVRWTKKLGVWGWILVAVGGFALTLAVVVVGSIYLQRLRIERMVARIRAAGEPATQGELEPLLPAIPSERDATRLWLDGFTAHSSARKLPQAQFDKLPFVGKFRPDGPPVPGTDWPELALAEEYLADHAEALRLFHEAAEIGGAARLQPVYDPFNPNMGTPRNAVRLLLLESNVRAHKGQAGGAVASLETAFAVGKACEGSPYFIPFLTHLAIDSVTIEQILWLLPHTEFSDAQLARLQSTLRAIDPRREHLNVLFGERIFGIRLLGDPSLLGGPGSGFKSHLDLALLRNVAVPHIIETMTEAVAATKLPWPEALDKANEIKEREEAIPLVLWLEAMAMPNQFTGFDAVARGTARIWFADIALAAQRYRLANGRLPQSIDDMVPDFLPSIPLDLYTGEPLHYAPTDDGFVVYSVGADRKDDGGLLDEFQTREPDLGYRIRYPKEGADASTE